MKYFLLLLCFVVGKSCWAQSVSLNRSSDYIAIFGDIQYLTNKNYSYIYRHSLDWISNEYNKGIPFKCVLHTGDVTQKNREIQWKCFYEETRDLANTIPYFSMIGDHDYTWEEGVYINDRESTLYNEYLNFPLSEERVVAQFEDGRMENSVVKIDIRGEPLYFLILEFGPREEVVDWAVEYVKAHPDRKFILLNHEYLEKGGERRINNLKCIKRFINSSYTTPDQLWERLIKSNNNILCVLCGHVGGLYALTIERNDFGREVPQIQHNIQSSTYRYDNWLMLWEFPTYSDSVNVSIVNTNTLSYYENNKILFKFRYKNSKGNELGLIEVRNSDKNAIRKQYNLRGMNYSTHRRGDVFIQDNKKYVSY